MGAALLQKSSTSTTVRSTKGNTAAAAAAAATTTVRDIHSRSSDDEPKEESQSETPAFSERGTNHNSTTAAAATKTATTTTPFRRSSLPSAGAYTTWTLPVVVPNPHQQELGQAQQQWSEPQNRTSSLDQEEPLVQETRASRKRSRKDLERVLRQGNLSAAFDLPSSNTAGTTPPFVSLHQAHPEAYTPDPETYAVPTHGIRVAPTAMYDASAGTAVIGTNNSRGKNQIHQLLASAASLELQRARGLGTEKGKASSHRANAKTKYGW
jgi:hypothetical protein